MQGWNVVKNVQIKQQYTQIKPDVFTFALNTSFALNISPQIRAASLLQLK